MRILSVLVLMSMLTSSILIGYFNSEGDRSGGGSASQPQVLTAVDGKLQVKFVAGESKLPWGDSSRWAMTYNGDVVGPTLILHPGDHLNILLINHLKEATSLHTHGLHVSPLQDNPFIEVQPGKSREYQYDIPWNQPAGTFWYHPHVHGNTAEQVSAGLSGVILIENQDDIALHAISTDRVLVINDPPISTGNPWRVHGGHEMGMNGMMGMSMHSAGVNMMTSMVGRRGPKLLTNGATTVAFSNSHRLLERFHIVNATASARLKISFKGSHMFLLSSSGGRLPKPLEIKSFILSSGERSEVLITPDLHGGSLIAKRLSNEEGASRGGRSVALATISPDAGTSLSQLPGVISHANFRDLFSPQIKVVRHRVIELLGHMSPTIDGRLFNASRVDFEATRGTIEEWVIHNKTPMFHPIHLHTWGFQVRGEMGWQDTVTIPPHSTRTIRIAFDDFVGTSVLHCHILDHEDTGMMSVIRVNP